MSEYAEREHPDAPLPEGTTSVSFLCHSTGDWQHAQVFHRAFLLYQERNARHLDAWRPGEVKGNMVKLRLKVERAWRQLFKGGSDPTEELLDVLNYCAFTVRSCDDDDWDGGWEW